MPAPLPYEFLPDAAPLGVRSEDIADGTPLARPQVSGILGQGGEDRSPHLAWDAGPAGTASYAVTCFDPDAPTGSGFWHWVLFDVPASVTELAAGAGAQDGSGLPAGAIQARNDAGLLGFLGAGPPPGHGPHRYAFAVHALDVDTLGPDASATPAFVGFSMFGHVLARGLIVATHENTG